MLPALELHPLAGIDQQPVLDLAAPAGHVSAEHLVPHLQKDLVHPKRVVLRDLLCLVKCHPGQRFNDISLQEDIMRLFAIVKPALDPQIVDEIGLDLVDRAVVLSGECPVAAQTGSA